MINWEKWDKEVVKQWHGDIYFYRALYDGDHAQLFPRAINLLQSGEITDQIINGTNQARNVQTPYIMANVCKSIAEVPATFVSRSIGDLSSSLDTPAEQARAVGEQVNDTTDNLIEGGDTAVYDAQQEIIEQIQKNSNLRYEHWSNIVQQQVDGGLVGFPVLENGALRIEFKQRDVYYPHEDGNGCDIVFERTIDDDDYIQVERHRVDNGNLTIETLLYRVDEGNLAVPIDIDEAIPLLRSVGYKGEMVRVFKGRQRPLVHYWANDKTFINPLGKSCLKGQAGKQDEVNWTLTRNAITFERNGKPRIAVTMDIFNRLQESAQQRYGNANRLDHRDLEVTTMDENGNSIEVMQLDITKIGNIEWVKDLVKLMLQETSTSEKAIDFYTGDNASVVQSGVAKFYDLLTSIIKAERIQQEYVYFIQNLVEDCLWLANYNDPNVIIERPEVNILPMIPVSRKEIVEDATKSYNDGVQSLETTIKALHPYATQDWIHEEIARINETEEDPFMDVNEDDRQRQDI